MSELNMNAWERRDAYQYFSSFSNPFYMVSFRLDVSDLYRYTKERGLSFYAGMIWVCTEALNRVEAFHMTVRDGKPVRLPRRDPSFTALKPGAEQFHIVTMEHIEDMDAFCRTADRLSKTQDRFLDEEKESDQLIYYSCLPWIDLTAMTNERNLSAPGALDDSIPRLCWGKYTEENGRKTLGVSMEVNHRLIDGVHIGRFAEQFGEITSGLAK